MICVCRAPDARPGFAARRFPSADCSLVGKWHRDFADRLTRLTDSAISSGLGTVQKIMILHSKSYLNSNWFFNNPEEDNIKAGTSKIIYLTFFRVSNPQQNSSLLTKIPRFAISKWSRLERTVRNSSATSQPMSVSVFTPWNTCHDGPPPCRQECNAVQYLYVHVYVVCNDWLNFKLKTKFASVIGMQQQQPKQQMP